jgi:hypothetical protein
VSNPKTAAKQRWNDKNYKQIKIYASPEIVERFRVVCDAQGVSMSGELCRAMSEKIGAAGKARQKRDMFSTRGLRRKSLQAIISQLETMRGAEEQYKENIPDNLQTSVAYDNADRAVSTLEDAIALLEDVY